MASRKLTSSYCTQLLNFNDSSTLQFAEIEKLRANLENYSQTHPAINFKYSTTKEVKSAGILVPICLHNNKLSILFTLRTSGLSSHPGEISFPGGKWDPADTSLQHTALRETHEEIGIPPDTIDIIGQLNPLPNYSHTIKVYPFIGFIPGNITWPAESPPLNSSKNFPLIINHDEVEQCFAISISELISPHGIASWDQFRRSQIRVPRFRAPDTVPGEIWGLTAFVLYQTLQVWFPNSLSTPNL